MEYVVITGSNRGIGLALVAQYAALGARVFALCRRPDEASELQAVAAASAHVSVHLLEVTSDDSIQAAVQAIAGVTDRVDILINNAGMNGAPGTRGLATLDRAALNTMLDTNATSAVLVTAAFLTLLRHSDQPRVVMVSSQMGSLSYIRSGKNYGYAMSKAAMNMGARVLAAEFGGDGITTITLHPGWVRTDMGGEQGELSPEESAKSIAALVNGLTTADNGAFYNWNGSVHEW